MKPLASSHTIFLIFLFTCSWWNVARAIPESTQGPESQLGSSILPENTSPSPTPPSPQEDHNLTGTNEPSVSESPSVASTTTSEAPTTSTSTLPPTTTEKPFTFTGEGESTKGYFCLCDLHVRSCDMNCCCDTDCSIQEKSLFTGCTGSVIYDPKNHRHKDHSCMKSYIMYRENIPYRIDRTDKSLFCIVKENVKQGREFSQKDMARIRNKISHGKINSKPKYGWDHLHFLEDFKISPTPYKYGSPIWIEKDVESEENGEGHQETRILRLPTSYHTQKCSLNEPVKFLVDTNSTCSLSIFPLDIHCESLRALNANNFIKDFAIIINPTKKEENSTGYIVRKVIRCPTDSKRCENIVRETIAQENGDVVSDEVKDIEFLTPVLSSTNQKCLNVLSNLNLTFVHDGMEGIDYTIAEVEVKDVSLDSMQIQQRFTVNFIWGSKPTAESVPQVEDVPANNTNEASSVEDILALRKLPRSGNPGYIVGKPIILGKKKEKPVGVNSTGSERMQVSLDDSKWLHIHEAGNCPADSQQLKKFSKYPVVFGYEQISSCRLPLEPFLYCEQLQKHITSILLGTDKDPQEMTKSPPYVAAYGSPDAFPSDWVPLKFIDISSLLTGSSNNLIGRGCDITTSIHVTIAYAYVGPVDTPQAKITGVFYEPEEPIRIPAADAERNNRRVRDLEITATVSFVDVSGKPTSRVATWPVLSIQLPSDFFYPFSSSSTSPPSSGGEKTQNPNLSRSFVFILMFVGIFVVV